MYISIFKFILALSWCYGLAGFALFRTENLDILVSSVGCERRACIALFFSAFMGRFRYHAGAWKLKQSLRWTWETPHVRFLESVWTHMEGLKQLEESWIRRSMSFEGGRLSPHIADLEGKRLLDDIQNTSLPCARDLEAWSLRFEDCIKNLKKAMAHQIVQSVHIKFD